MAIWVKFQNIPTECWTTEGLSTVASAVGRPLYPDAFTSSMERIDYARVCVIIDINSNFKDHVYMLLPSRDGEYNGSCKVHIEYEWRPRICSVCKNFGHKDGECPLAKKVIQRPKPVQIFVPKVNKEEKWQEQKSNRKNLEMPKEKPAKEIQEPNVTTHNVCDNNPFALLENLESDEGNMEDVNLFDSIRGPIQAAPIDVDR